MPDADRAMMRGAAFGPVVHEAFGSNAEFVAAVGIADLKSWAGNGFAFGHLAGKPIHRDAAPRKES